MITKCQFCDFGRERELSRAILEVLADKELPEEDYILWLKRLLDIHGLKEYHGVKIHMGRMHKDRAYPHIQPAYELTAAEAAVLMI